jgi:hypothetical protein
MVEVAVVVYAHTEEKRLMVAVGPVQEDRWVEQVKHALLEWIGADSLLQLKADVGTSLRNLVSEVVTFALGSGLEASFLHTVPIVRVIGYPLEVFQRAQEK